MATFAFCMHRYELCGTRYRTAARGAGRLLQARNALTCPWCIPLQDQLSRLSERCRCLGYVCMRLERYLYDTSGMYEYLCASGLPRNDGDQMQYTRIIRRRAYHLFETMVAELCGRDKGNNAMQLLIASDWLRVRVYSSRTQGVSTVFSNKW